MALASPPWSWPSGLCKHVGMSADQPTPTYEQALEEFTRTKEAHEEAKKTLRVATAEKLKATGMTTKELAPTSPWSEETLRGIAREYGIERKRQPTVRSIKPKKRTTGGDASG